MCRLEVVERKSLITITGYQELMSIILDSGDNRRISFLRIMEKMM